MHGYNQLASQWLGPRVGEETRIGDGSSRPTRRDFILSGMVLVAAGTLQSMGSRAQQRGPDGRYKPEFRKRTREEVKYQSEP